MLQPATDPGTVLNRAGPAVGRKSFALERENQTTLNFWDVGSYKRVVKRIEDGATLLDDMQKMLLERAAIEKKYAGTLQQWSKKWEGKIDRGAEVFSASTRSAWQGLLVEADANSKEHLRVEQKITGELQNKTTHWRKDNYQKAIMTSKHKLTKKVEDGFEKVQKPWAKLLGKVDRSKNSWHATCKTVQGLEKTVAKFEASSKVTPDDVRKVKDKLAKAQTDSANAKTKYEKRLTNLNNDVARYEAEMKDQFTICQDAEQKRIDFFKVLMTDYLRVLRVDHSHAYVQLQQTIEGINADADLVQYSETHGVGMDLVVPQFTPFDETKEPRSSVADVGASDAIKSLNSCTSPLDCDNDSDEEWESACPLPPPETSKVLVRAIYDYVAEDPEELSITTGDVVTQIEAEDGQGWCKGVNEAGQVGYFPAHYVAPHDSPPTQESES